MKKLFTHLLLALALVQLAGCSIGPSVSDSTQVATEQPVAQAPHLASAAPPHSERSGIGLQFRASEAFALDAGVTVDVRRSLVVTEQAVLQNFALKEVLDQLIAQSGVPGLTSLQLFHQLWDTQNQRPGLGLGGHCNDQVDSSSNPIFNNYPYACPRDEGTQVTLADPFTNSAYVAVGLFNRFDLAPVNGSECGEYRIVFAKNPARTDIPGRNFIIFEAALPNPHPGLGLDGCLPVARFWQQLTADGSLASRTSALRNFYFQGLPGFLPVVHMDGYGADPARGTGQIRTNMFMDSVWLLREFKLQKTCGTSGCTALKAVIATDKVNPFGGLFNPNSGHPLAADFRTFFPSQVEALANPDINLFNYEVPDRFNGGQSDAQGFENNYVSQFGMGGSLKPAIEAELARIGSTLTADHIIRRARALSCAGCHQLSNGDNVGASQLWPSSLGFTHTSEFFIESGPEGARFGLSPALVNVFLPHRKRVLEEFLNRSRPHHDGRVAAGWNHSLAVRPDGTVWAAGSNNYGQLGDGTTNIRFAPVQVLGLGGAVSVGAGHGHSLVLRSDGTVWAWGANSSGQLGDGTTTNRAAPVQVPGLSGVMVVAAGRDHSLALRSDGTVWAWGSNNRGQLGDGTTTDRAAPAQMPGLNEVVSVAAGSDHSLAVRSDGTVWTWGRSSQGGSLPTQVPGLSGTVVVAAGSSHSLAVRFDGTVWTWSDGSPPTQVQGLSGIVSVAGGDAYSLAVRSDGTVWAWGSNSDGQLGDGTTTYRAAPVQVQGLGEGGVVAVGAGYAHALAVRSDGTAWAWGSNFHGQQGNGTASNAFAPTQVQGLSGIRAIATGRVHTLVLRSDGTVWAWGSNSFGQLGDGSRVSRATPAQVQTLSGVTAVAAGSDHSLAVRSDGAVWVWGAIGGLTPVQVQGLGSITAVAAGTRYSLALRSDGTVWAWGSNSNGQLGNGTTISSGTPVQVQGLMGAVAVVAGTSHSLARRSDGTAWAWGLNHFSQLGDGTNTARTAPVQVQGLSGTTAVAANRLHSLAMRAEGTAWAWGDNFSSQLGDGTRTGRAAPVQVQGLSGVVDVAGGSSHSLAVRSGGTVWAWGDNSYGQLGNSTTIDRSTPAQVPGLNGAVAVAAGDSHSLALLADGTVWSWGSNAFGELGNGPTGPTTTAVHSLLFGGAP